MDKYIIDRVIEAARIEEVVGDFIDLKKRGQRYLGLCPFHDDRHLGSFVVYPRGNCYKCFMCDAKGGAVDFLMNHAKLSFPDAIRWLGRKYSIETDGEALNFTPPPPRPKPAPLPMLTLPMTMVTAREDVSADPLVTWIRTGIRWDGVARARIEQAIASYHIGHSRHGHTIFWQIDDRGLVRTGKMMRYGADGHRDKVTPWNFDFIHAALFRDQRLPQYSEDKQEMVQTLFGMHLIDSFGKCATVCIVESEKTALLMSIAYGNHSRQIWMACGGIENLSSERLKPIISRRRRIILYPDRDGIERWKAKAAEIGYERMAVDTRAVTSWWTPADGPKADIADVVIRIINESEPITTISDVARKIPEAKPMIDQFDLEVASEGAT